MKRPHKGAKKLPARTIDIKKDLTQKHLAAISAFAIAYNELESALDSLFFAAIDLPDSLGFEVSTRINGTEGRAAIVRAAAETLGLTKPDIHQIAQMLALFGQFKTHRDAVIHSRVINAFLGISIERRGRLFDVLISEEAMHTLYDHVIALRKELDDATHLLISFQRIKRLSADGRKKAKLEGAIQELSLRFRSHRSQRQSLPPLPKFPKESEFRALANQWQQAQQDKLVHWFPPGTHPSGPGPTLTTMMSWFQPDSPNLQHQRNMSAALLSTLGVQDTPFPLRMESQKEPHKKP